MQQLLTGKQYALLHCIDLLTVVLHVLPYINKKNMVISLRMSLD